MSQDSAESPDQNSAMTASPQWRMSSQSPPSTAGNGMAFLDAFDDVKFHLEILAESLSRRGSGIDIRRRSSSKGNAAENFARA